MSKVINLTQHVSTPEQNCYDLEGNDLSILKRNLTFDTLPTAEEIDERVETLTALAWKHAYWNAVSEFNLSPSEDEDEILARARGAMVMIGGAPYLMAKLEAQLKKDGLSPVYSFTERKSIETSQNGEVKKVSVFKHVGWIRA